MATDFRKAYEQRFGVQKGWLKLYDAKGNLIYCEDLGDWWMKREYDEEGNVTYREYSTDYWVKTEYDEEGNQIYLEDSERGITLDNRETCEGKIVTIDGKEYQLTKVK